MRTTIYFLFAILIFSLSSCSEYGEEIWINADGSGRYQMSQDMSAMLPFIEMGIQSAKEKMAEKENEDGATKPKIDTKKLLSIFESGKVDTTINIEKLMAQSFEKDGKVYSRAAMKEDMMAKMMEDDKGKNVSTEDQNKMWTFFEGLMDMKTRIQYDKDNGTLKNTMSQSFKNPKDMLFGNFPELMEVISKYSGEDERLSDPAAKEAMEKMKDYFPTYEVGKTSIKVKRKAMDLSSVDEEAQQSMQMMKGMMGNSTYTLTVHVPGKVKKVSNSGAQFKGSTVTWTMSAMDMYDVEKDLNLDIKFKPKKGIKY